MSHLLRIIMINGHLEGVVELDLQGHSNICGTNASGKTTLQRLIPVFYGEYPNKVVPKTRKKFDQFYLPYANSYLVYEYRRETGETCMAVLTRKPDDGVQYRFVAAAYQAELFLKTEENGTISALDYHGFSSHLRQQKINFSHKIDSTSDYRAIIQNDFSSNRQSRQEVNKLKQLALSYSLAQHRLRHIEKLVSAVHAKEGKMDTLKTMLAAIFEEDGISLPSTHIKNTHVHQWVKQVRQAKLLDILQEKLAIIDDESQRLQQVEATLWQLHPQLIQNEKEQQTASADFEQQLAACREQLKQSKLLYESQRDELNLQISRHQTDLATTTAELDDIEKRHQDFLDRDMETLAYHIEQLPQQRTLLSEKSTHKRQLLNSIDNSTSEFDSQLLQLAQRVRENENKLRSQIEQQRELQTQCKAQQEQEEQSLRQQQQSQLDSIRQQAEQHIHALSAQSATLAERLKHNLVDTESQQELELAEALLESLQDAVHSETDWINTLYKQQQSAQQQQQNQLKALEQQTQQRQQAEQDYFAIKQQLEPKAGSLRAYLQQHYPQWQYSIGKVLQPALLERSDLAPYISEQNSDLILRLGIDLDLINVPDFARDDETLQLALEQANTKLNEQKQAEKQCQQEQEKYNLAYDEASKKLRSAQTHLEKTRSDVNNARNARDKLKEDIRQHSKLVKHKLELELEEIKSQLQTAKQALEKELQLSRQRFERHLLEKKAHWSEQLQSFDEKAQQLQQQVKQTQNDYQQQEQDIRQAKDNRLRELGLDPDTLQALENDIFQLEQHIRTTEQRIDELDDYKRFMRNDWDKRKPQLQQAEYQLEQDLHQAESQLEALQQSYKKQRSSQQEEITTLEHNIKAHKELANQLNTLLKRFNKLPEIQGVSLAENKLLQQLNLEQRIQQALNALEQHEELSHSLQQAITQFEQLILKDADERYAEAWLHNQAQVQQLPLASQAASLHNMVKILENERQNLIDQGLNYGQDLSNFFIVFKDLNNRIQRESRRLSEEVSEEFELEGISKSEVKILSTIDELNFWQPLKEFAEIHQQWQQHSQQLPNDNYLNKLSDVANLLRSEQQFTFESLLRIELHLNEGGNDLIIRSDRQLLESSSHGMAYLILCKYLLAFTRLLRGKAQVTIHWPIDEIGTLAYRNVEKLFNACDNNQIFIVGAFPNPESDVLSLFEQRYLIEKDGEQRKLKRIEPKLSRLSLEIQQLQEQQA